MVTLAASAPTAGVRTCVGCRGKAHRSELVRLVVDRQATVPTVVVDHRAVLPGRGVWLHQRPDCLGRADAHRAIHRGLRLSPTASIDEVRAWFDQHAQGVVDPRHPESG